MKKLITPVITTLLLLLVGATVASNYYEQISIDRSKLPEKVEDSRGFQKWITNLKNNDFTTSADEFRLKEENEIYNTKWMKVSSIDEKGKQEEFNKYIEQYKTYDKVEFSPSEREFVDYRHELRGDDVIGEYNPNEIHFYGLRDDKIINARLVDCSINANCYFDRAFFLNNTNDVFVVSEFSRNIDKKAENITPCSMDEECTYTIKLHVIDLINNQRLVYESEPFNIVLNKIIPEL